MISNQSGPLSRNHLSLSTSCVAAPMGDTLAPRSLWRLCCLIWFSEGRGWLAAAAATVSFVQSSTSLWRSSVNVPLLLLLLLLWTWASRVIGWGDGEGVAVVSAGCVWLEAVWAVVVLSEDPEKTQMVLQNCPSQIKMPVKSIGYCMAVIKALLMQWAYNFSSLNAYFQ